MSKLPNAPLIEVIFEIRWEMKSQKEFDKFELLIGSMHDALKDCFPVMRNLKPESHLPSNFFNNVPTFRFEANEGYPLYQLGPGVLSVNTVDSFYEWTNFRDLVFDVCKCFFERMDFEPDNRITSSLKYLDFYAIDSAKTDLNEFYKKNFKIEIKSHLFPSDPKPLFSNYSTAHLTDYGVLGIQITTGAYNSKKGVVVDNTLTGQFNSSNYNEITEKWIEDAHTSLGNFFKEMTKGELYETYM